MDPLASQNCPYVRCKILGFSIPNLNKFPSNSLSNLSGFSFKAHISFKESFLYRKLISLEIQVFPPRFHIEIDFLRIYLPAAKWCHQLVEDCGLRQQIGLNEIPPDYSPPPTLLHSADLQKADALEQAISFHVGF